MLIEEELKALGKQFDVFRREKKNNIKLGYPKELKRKCVLYLERGVDRKEILKFTKVSNTALYTWATQFKTSKEKEQEIIPAKELQIIQDNIDIKKEKDNIFSHSIHKQENRNDFSQSRNQSIDCISSQNEQLNNENIKEINNKKDYFNTHYDFSLKKGIENKEQIEFNNMDLLQRNKIYCAKVNINNEVSIELTEYGLVTSLKILCGAK